ncbi:hypothetical protein TNCT_380921 [Trichonephila clavata]|uniref:Uncharacterized protein n=1 Tax=Trichonephila clavata TaxID=2740835 RepID=A0A8X6HIF0_TRICU|nr:hypothetical protein TNCT_380921 [Trichonephila clavata]
MIGEIGDQEGSIAFPDLDEIVFGMLGDAGVKQVAIAVEDLGEIVFGELGGDYSNNPLSLTYTTVSSKGRF